MRSWPTGRVTGFATRRSVSRSPKRRKAIKVAARAEGRGRGQQACKQVTVLFADVVHSIDIAAAVGAERLREIMADLADRCAAVVQRYGGRWTSSPAMGPIGGRIFGSRLLGESPPDT
jgi:class 3 adenylate cyclase